MEKDDYLKQEALRQFEPVLSEVGCIALELANEEQRETLLRLICLGDLPSFTRPSVPLATLAMLYEKTHGTSVWNNRACVWHWNKEDGSEP